MSATFMWGLFILLCVIIIGLGLLLLILGIVQKKAGQWVPGILVTILAFVFCVVGLFFLIGKTANLPRNTTINYYDDNDPSQRNYEEYNDNDTTSADDEFVSTGEEYITGFIQDTDKSLIHIKVMPDAILKDMGITVNKIDTYVAKGSNTKTIPLNITFSNKFKGELQLIIFSSDNEELGKSLVQINQSENSTYTVKFLYEKGTNFLRTEYARLKSID